MKWSELSKDKFQYDAKFQRTTRIDVIWTGNLDQNTKIRTCVLNSHNDWLKVINEPFVPRYKDGRSPDDPKAEIYSLSEWCDTLTPEDFKEYAKCFQDGVYVTVARDTGFKAKFIADGLKRSAVIHDLIKNQKSFPPATIIECYGLSVHNIFGTEFSNIKRLPLKK